jgi:ATP-dependent Lon protease
MSGYFWYYSCITNSTDIANVLDTIPAPLLDRMEVMEVSGYVSEEKAVIADKYLAPQAKEASGLKNADVVLAADAIDNLIKYYCRESGVRNLKKHIEKVRLAG